MKDDCPSKGCGNAIHRSFYTILLSSKSPGTARSVLEHNQSESVPGCNLAHSSQTRRWNLAISIVSDSPHMTTLLGQEH